MKKKDLFNLYNNYDIEYNIENEDDFMDYDNMQWQYCEDELEKINKKYSKFIILGQLGLWNGTYSIQPVINNDLMELVRKAINEMDYVIINNTLNLTCIHHDGTNKFKIYAIKENLTNKQFENLENKAYYGEFGKTQIKRYCKGIII